MKYTVYHVDESGEPYNHDKTNGLWFFEPYMWIRPVYSYGYPTKEAAENAAKEHLKDIHDIYEAADVRPTKLQVP